MPRPRPQVWTDLTGNEVRNHTLDWRAPLRGATISSVSWVSKPAGLVFSGSAITGTKTTITITPPAIGAKGVKYEVHAKIVTSIGETLETEPPLELTVQPGGAF